MAVLAFTEPPAGALRVTLPWRTEVQVHDLTICLLDVSEIPGSLVGTVVRRVPRVRLRIQRRGQTRTVFVSEETLALGYYLRLAGTNPQLLLDVAPARLG